jgi:hypothetical protein
LVSISDEDLQALMTVIHRLEGAGLDLILHSPGGSIEAAEALVTYLRSRFPEDICVIVPQQAMSAATMIACAANTIMLGKHSFLGPTDPQFILRTELGVRVVTAQNVEEQFERARKECADPTKIGAWIPILKTYGPDLLEKCRMASELSKSLVSGWLEHYMFKGEPDAKRKALMIAEWLGGHKHHQTHGRHIGREELRAKGMTKITDLEADQELQDIVLSIFHATTLTFDHTGAVKLVENHMGKAFIKSMQTPMMQGPPMMLPPGMLPPGTIPPGFPLRQAIPIPKPPGQP